MEGELLFILQDSGDIPGHVRSQVWALAGAEALLTEGQSSKASFQNRIGVNALGSDGENDSRIFLLRGPFYNVRLESCPVELRAAHRACPDT